MNQNNCFVTAEKIYQKITELRNIKNNAEEENSEQQNSEQQNILLFVCERCIEMVKSYCNIQQIPMKLENVCVEIALLLFDNGNYQYKNTALKSIKEGNVSVTYQYSSDYKNQYALLKTFSQELDRFRKMKW